MPENASLQVLVISTEYHRVSFLHPSLTPKQCQTEANPVYMTSQIFGVYIEKIDLCLLNTSSGGRFVWHAHPHTRLQVKTRAVHPKFTADNAVVTAFDHYEQAAIIDTLYSSSFFLRPVFQEFWICSGGRRNKKRFTVTLAGMSFGEFSSAAGEQGWLRKLCLCNTDFFRI